MGVKITNLRLATLINDWRNPVVILFESLTIKSYNLLLTLDVLNCLK